jgi:hypothetical protein
MDSLLRGTGLRKRTCVFDKHRHGSEKKEIDLFINTGMVPPRRDTGLKKRHVSLINTDIGLKRRK